MKLKWILGVSALFVASCSAFFSVTGLGLLFHGASTSVIVMASSLELAKLVTAGYLKQKWEELAKLLKFYLSFAVFILMIITSLGIYGYLSDAFQQQNIQLEKVEREISVFDNKIKVNEREINRYQDKITNLTTLRNSQEQNYSKLIDQEKGTSRIYNMIKSADAEIKTSSLKVDSLNSQNVKLYQQIDSVKNANIRLEKQVGGFRFVSEALGVDMNTAVKWFILLLVLVFDPLAVAMVLAYVRFSPDNQKKNLIRKRIDAEVIKGLHLLDREKSGSSQNGEEAFISYILSYIGQDNYLVEILGKGETDYSNFKYFLEKGYLGILIVQDNPDPNSRNAWTLKKNIFNHYIIKHNVKPILKTYDCPETFDALSIDLNGNDFWVLEEILSNFRPRLIIAEFNPSKDGAVAINYEPIFKWMKDDYYGFSFEAGKKLAEKYGYNVIFQNDNINLYMVAQEYVDMDGVPDVKYEKKISFPHNPHGKWVNV